ncbi:MAG: dCTP deaminase [Halobacteriaceae archaeon]
MPSATDAVTDLVHADTQVHEQGVDLTVASVARLETPGQVDFGGDELADPTTTTISPDRRPGDAYGWWSLEAGTYLIEYNETVTTDTPVVCQPRPALTARGATHPTQWVTDLQPMPLTTAGIDLKENARISTVVDPNPR